MPGESILSAPPAPPRGRWLLLLGVWLCYASFGLVATSLAPLIPMVEAELGLNHSAMGLVLGAWQLVYIFSAIPCGFLLDRVGARHALLLGAILIAASAVGRSQATSYPELLAAVMLFGVGGPIISSGAPKVVANHFRGAERGLAMGIYMTGPAVGSVTSLSLSHPLLLPALDGSWRALLAAGGGFALFSGLFWWLISGLCAERAQSVRQPLAPEPVREVFGALSRVAGVRRLLWMGMGVFAFDHGLNAWLPELLRVEGYSVIAAGAAAAVPTLVGMSGALVIPRLAVPERRRCVLLLLCAAAAGASILLQDPHGATLGVGLLLQGIARSSLMTILVLALVEMPAVGARRAGAASGLFFSAAEVGGMLGPIAMGLAYESTGGFSSGLFGLTVTAALLGFGALALPGPPGMLSCRRTSVPAARSGSSHGRFHSVRAQTIEDPALAIQEGEKIPSVTLKATDMSDLSTDELFSGKKVVLFAVPGAFTPTCSNQHLPGYIEHSDAIRAKGVDEIVCLSVNDAFVMGAWAEDRGAGDKVRLVADGNGDLTKAIGLEMDGSGIGFGLRCQRFAAIVEDGVVTKLAVEEPMKFEASAAEVILEAL